MKTTSLYSVFAALAFALLLSSCAFLQKGEFAQRKYYDFPRSKHAENQTASVVKQNKAVPPVVVAQDEQKAPAPILTASANKKEIIAAKTENRKQKNIKRSAEITPAANEQAETVISFKRSDVKKQAKKLAEHLYSNESGLMLFIMVLAAIFIPPLGVYIKDHHTNKWFWITLILCLFGGGLYLFYLGVMGLLWLVAVVIALMDVFDIL